MFVSFSTFPRRPDVSVMGEEVIVVSISYWLFMHSFVHPSMHSFFHFVTHYVIFINLSTQIKIETLSLWVYFTCLFVWHLLSLMMGKFIMQILMLLTMTMKDVFISLVSYCLLIQLIKKKLSWLVTWWWQWIFTEKYVVLSWEVAFPWLLTR